MWRCLFFLGFLFLSSSALYADQKNSQLWYDFRDFDKLLAKMTKDEKKDYLRWQGVGKEALQSSRDLDRIKIMDFVLFKRAYPDQVSIFEETIVKEVSFNEQTDFKALIKNKDRLYKELSYCSYGV